MDLQARVGGGGSRRGGEPLTPVAAGPVEVHFIFSDESGVYEPSPSRRFLRAHPFYCRAAIGLSVSDWLQLRNSFETRIRTLGIPADKELKWSYVQSVVQHRVRGEAVPEDRDYSWCASFTNEHVLGFVRDLLASLAGTTPAWGVLTFTTNTECQVRSTDLTLQWHIQELMQRAEMHLRPTNGLGLVSLDPTADVETDRRLRAAYAEMYRNGDFIERYRHVKDSLAFEVSHHSFGIWLADYVVGALNGWLKGYPTNTALFSDCVWPILRKDGSGRAEGWGIRGVPGSPSTRRQLRDRCDDRSTPRRFGT